MVAVTLEEDGVPALWGSVGGTVAPAFLFSSPSLDFVSTVAHFSPPDCLNSRPFPLPALPVSGTPPAPVPTGRCRLLSGTRTARAGNKSGFHDSLPSSNAPNLSPPGSPLGARGAGRAVPAVKAAAGAPAGRGAGGGVWPGWGEGSVAWAGRLGKGVVWHCVWGGGRRDGGVWSGCREWEGCSWRRGWGWGVRRIHRA